MTATLSGFCGITNPMESHDRCAKSDCPCIHHRMTVAASVPSIDPLAGVVSAVQRLAEAVPALLDACTDPQGTDMAELLDIIREQRTKLYALEGQVEEACARALLDDMTTTPTLRIERHRTTDRKAWDHAGWQRDVRAKVLQAAGLKGAQGVLTADGEVVPASVLYDLLAQVEQVHGSAAPKTTALRSLGLDARDYCESSPGRWTVKVTRMADETEQEGAA